MTAIRRVEAHIAHELRLGRESKETLAITTSSIGATALHMGDLRAVLALAKQVALLKMRINAAAIHLDRAINWEPRPETVIRGDAQLALHALHGPLSKPKRKRHTSRGA